MTAQELYDNWSAYLRDVDRPDFMKQIQALVSTKQDSPVLGNASPLSETPRGDTAKEVEVIDPWVMDLVRKHGHEMTNSEIVQKFLPKQRLAAHGGSAKVPDGWQGCPFILGCQDTVGCNQLKRCMHTGSSESNNSESNAAPDFFDKCSKIFEDENEPTPRTDAAAFDISEGATVTHRIKCVDGAYVDADFARQLERELAQHKKALEAAASQIEHYESLASASGASNDSILVDGWVAAVRDLAADLGRKNDPVGAYYDWQYIVSWIAGVRLASSSPSGAASTTASREGKE